MTTSGRKLKILLLADPMANAKQWISGMEKYGNAEVVNLYLQNRGKLKRTIEWVLLLFTIKKKINRINPDIVIGYRITSYGFLAAWSRFKPCVIAAQGVTDVWPEDHWTTPFKAMIARYAIRHADLIHAWGNNMVSSILKYGANESRVFVMPKGIDIDIFHSDEKKENKVHTFCVTRSLYPEYGHMLILTAFKRLIREGYDLELIIAGTGDLQTKMEEYINENKLEGFIKLVGKVSMAEIYNILNRSNVYISMPETEGVSASLFEAMACGCFPIVSDLPANSFIVNDGENGYLVPVNNGDILYEKIKKIINDPGLLKKASIYNKEYVCENADMKKNIGVFIEKYKEISMGYRRAGSV